MEIFEHEEKSFEYWTGYSGQTGLHKNFSHYERLLKVLLTLVLQLGFESRLLV